MKETLNICGKHTYLTKIGRKKDLDAGFRPKLTLDYPI
jgi:hypothetical protein